MSLVAGLAFSAAICGVLIVALTTEMHRGCGTRSSLRSCSSSREIPLFHVEHAHEAVGEIATVIDGFLASPVNGKSW